VKFFDQKEIEEVLNYPELVNKLEDSFQNQYGVPPRARYDFKSGEGDDSSSLLLMPVWQNEKYVGLKILTASPYNNSKNLATIQGIFILMDAKDGEIIAQFDAKSLTNRRTAAASALASKYLSRENSSTLLMIGTGALAPELIRAHCSVRPIHYVQIWGRDFEKAKQLADRLAVEHVEIVPIADLNKHISKADIISTATSADKPLVFGDRLSPGQHIDLVGAFKPTWRESDDHVIQNSSVFVDTRQGTLKESGELLIPMEKGVFKAEDIKADLFELCKNQKYGRSTNEEITSFISVGYALEDLAAAELVWERGED